MERWRPPVPGHYWWNTRIPGAGRYPRPRLLSMKEALSPDDNLQPNHIDPAGLAIRKREPAGNRGLHVGHRW